MSPGVDAFMKKYDRAAADPDLQRWRQKVEEGRLDQLAYIADRVGEAREIALAEGIELGHDKDVAIICALVSGEPIDAIAEKYSVSEDNVKEIHAAMHSKDS